MSKRNNNGLGRLKLVDYPGDVTACITVGYHALTRNINASIGGPNRVRKIFTTRLPSTTVWAANAEMSRLAAVPYMQGSRKMYVFM